MRSVLKRNGRRVAALVVAAVVGFAPSMTVAQGDNNPRAGTVAPPHDREQETETIRRHHLNRAADHLGGNAEAIEKGCKYESEISTPPPFNRVVLTFDDGPEPGQTEYILGVLDKYGVRGSFFLIGEKAKAHPELVAKILASGRHTVGNHSWSHPNFHDIDVARQRDEVLHYEEGMADGPVKRLFRYPYGNSTCDTNQLLRERGYKIVGWHVDTCDWAFDKNGTVDAREALSCGVIAQNRGNYVEHVLSTVRAHKGGVVLMHEIHPNTIKDLERIVVKLREEGYFFGSIEDMEFYPALR